MRSKVSLEKPRFSLRPPQLNLESSLEEIHELNKARNKKIRIVNGYYTTTDPERMLFNTHPYLELYWDFEKNKGINPAVLTASSDLYVWWTCRCKHSLWMKIRVRTRSVECPTCIKLTTPIKDSLLEKYPHIAKEWDYEKNYPQLPIATYPCARKKVWWICSEKGHSYAAPPDNRVRKGTGCLRCTRSRPRKKRSKPN